MTMQKNNVKVNNARQLDDSKLSLAACLAFVPLTGTVGVHNFILGQYKRGIIHIIILVLPRIPYDLTVSIFKSSSKYSYILLLLQFLGISSYIMAVIEGVQILQSKKSGSSPRSAAVDTDSSQKLEPKEALVQTTNVANSIHPVPGSTVVKPTKRNQDRKIWSILSFVTTIVPIILFVYCFSVSRGSFNENGAGVIWRLVIIYYYSLGIPLFVMAISFGIIGLKTSLRWLSIVSLSIKAVMIVAIVVFLFKYS